jgi:hypothetical protein
LAAVVALLLLVPSIAAGEDGDKVVVSRPGVVFHTVGSGDLRGRGVDKSRDEALAAGYSPCPVCFAAKKVAVAPASGLSFGATVASTRGHVGLPPVLSPAPVSQPFGLRLFGHGRGGGSTQVTKNPYREPETIRNPGPEQGAYSTP